MTETETVETTETPESDAPHKDPDLAKKHGWIDYDKLPEEVRGEVKERLTGLRESLRERDEAFNNLADHTRAMERRLADMEARDQQKETTSKLAEVRTGLVKANEKGDYETVAKLNEQLIDLKAPKAAPVREVNDQLEEQNAQMLMAWQSTLTDDGRIARPWAHRTHPKYSETISQLTEVTDDPAFKGKGFEAILKEVDRRMMPKPNNATPVSDGDASPPRPSGKSVQLTEGQKKAAVRLYPSMKPADAIKRYTEAQKKYGDQ